MAAKIGNGRYAGATEKKRKKRKENTERTKKTSIYIYKLSENKVGLITWNEQINVSIDITYIRK